MPDGDSEQHSTSSGSALERGLHQCPQCTRVFKRPEHLKRHARAHEAHKQFSCEICGKSFARSDILQRHQHTHLAVPRPTSDSRRRACVECAKAREKCTKEETCLRCFNRSLECVYPPRRSVKAVHASPADATRAAWDTTPPSNARRQARLTAPEPQISPTTSLPNSRPSDISSIASGPDSPLHDMCPQLATVPVVGEVLSPTVQSQALLGSTQTRYTETSGWDPLIQQPGGSNRIMEYPMNWLPFNDSIGLDYNSILGFNMSSFNAFDTVSMTVTDQALLGSASNALDPYTMDDAGVSSLQHPPNFSQPPIQTAVVNNVVTVASPATTINSSSQGSSTGSRATARSGLYVTSNDGARTACTARNERHQHFIYGTTALESISDSTNAVTEDIGGFQFPSLDNIIPANTGYVTDSRVVSPEVYRTLRQQFRILCLGQPYIYPAFTSQDFPALSHLNFFIHLYFEHFDSILPIIHQTTDFNESWLLLLAICAIGSQYTQTQEFEQCVRPFHEFLRRAVAHEVESQTWTRCTIPFMQALVLNQVGLLYYGSSRFSVQGRARHGTLVEIAHCSGLMDLSGISSAAMSSGDLEGRSWQEWIGLETRRRLAFSLWLLDCMSVYHLGQNPASCLDPPKDVLPNSMLWTCKSATEWFDAVKKPENNTTLTASISSLFIDKELKHELGGFESLLVLHGIYQEIFKVKDYHARPLSSWVPSLQWTLASPKDVHDQEALELQNASNISNWRNAALDCVDVLHWAANAIIAKAAGVEHPNVLHLHFARVVLLAPYKSIQTLAKSIMSLKSGSPANCFVGSRDEVAAAEQDILRWAQQDEHKARLSVLHCGCFFWHIRRYSRDAFYEPLSVYLVTLTLWAYSAYTSRALPSETSNRANSTQAHLNQSHSRNIIHDTSSNSDNPVGHSNTIYDPRCVVNEEDDENREPTFIRLDRPNDDEMVQLFVRKGRPSAMTAHIAGVGNICSSQGPVKILREGRKILSTVSSAWGRSRKQISILEAMERTMIEKQ